MMVLLKDVSKQGARLGVVALGMAGLLAGCGGSGQDGKAPLAAPAALAAAVSAAAQVVAGAAAPSSPTVDASAGPLGQDAAAYQLSYIDYFETGLDRQNWSDHLWNETANPTVNYIVENGSLKIWPQRDASGQFFNRTMNTDGHFSQTYGYFEIDAKLPKGVGSWPGFMLFNHIGDNRSEIDVMKAAPGAGGAWGRAGADGVLAPLSYGSAVATGAGNQAWSNASATADLSAAFHKYGLKWDASTLRFYFDGKEVYSDEIAMSDPMFLALHLWFGGASGAPGAATPTGKANAYEVRYVKAWKPVRKAQGQALAPADATTAWTRCASEGGTCNFSGTRQVRYGNGSTFFYKTATTSLACTNAVFGDPLPTQAKYCDFAADVAPAPAPAPAPDGWTRCATEGGACAFSGTRQVRYGAGTTYFYKSATTSIACTNAVFGDPLPGQAKNCDYGPASTPPASSWIPCAAENGTCSFSGTRQVRYGAGTGYFYKSATASIACTNAVFGDPLPTLSKSCDYAADGGTPPPPPPPTGGAPAQAQAAGFKNLVFGDEFNSLNISPDGTATAPWYNGIWYESPSPASRYTLNSGALTATVLPSDPHEAWLTTLNRGGGQSGLFNLGYFEARMKWNNVPDNFSAFWLESSEHALANASLFCEIDIFEAYQNGVFVGTVHDWIGNNSTQNNNNWHPVGVDMTQWHTYGLLWTTDTITWYFDNQPLMSWPTPTVCKTQKLFMLVGAQQRAHANQVNLDVDWVHVYR